MADQGAKRRKDRLRIRYKDWSLKKLFPAVYKKAAKQPVIPGSVVFLEVREKELTDNFRLIQAALEERNRESSRRLEGSEEGGDTCGGSPKGGIRYQMDTVCIREGMEHSASVLARCLTAIPKIARAEYVFVNESSYFLSSLPIRPQTLVINTWHACGAFKKFGYSAVGKGFGTSREDLDRYPVHGNFSYVTVSAREVVWAYAEAFHMEDRAERILPIGVSRTDLYFRSKVRRHAAIRVRRSLEDRCPALEEEPAPIQPKPAGLPAGNGRRASGAAGGYPDINQERVFQKIRLVLYAPTYRGSVRGAAAPEGPDLADLRAELGDSYRILMKQHPFVKGKTIIPKEAEGFAIDVSDLRIEDLIMASDLLVTDYSSIIFEYALFEKPMIFYSPDLADYERQRGFYYPIREMMPGPITQTPHDLAKEILQLTESFDKTQVRNFKYRFMEGCDGHATARLVRLMEKCHGIRT